jgi:hypothetical protein
MPPARGTVEVWRLLENGWAADTGTGLPFGGRACCETHRRHKKEVAGPIPVSNCLKNG